MRTLTLLLSMVFASSVVAAPKVQSAPQSRKPVVVALQFVHAEPPVRFLEKYWEEALEEEAEKVIGSSMLYTQKLLSDMIPPPRKAPCQFTEFPSDECLRSLGVEFLLRVTVQRGATKDMAGDLIFRFSQLVTGRGKEFDERRLPIAITQKTNLIRMLGNMLPEGEAALVRTSADETYTVYLTTDSLSASQLEETSTSGGDPKITKIEPGECVFSLENKISKLKVERPFKMRPRDRCVIELDVLRRDPNASEWVRCELDGVKPRLIVEGGVKEPPPQAVPYKPAPADPTRKPIADGRAPEREIKPVVVSKPSPLKKFLWVAPAAFGLVPLIGMPLVIVGGAVIYGAVSSLIYSMNNDRAAKAGYASGSPYRTRIQNALRVDYIIAATLVLGSPLVVLGLTAATTAVGAGLGFKFIRPKE